MNHPILAAVRTLLKETFDGPEENASWYTEARPGSGIFGTLEHLSAEAASIPLHGSTIASQTDHIRYYLWAANAHLNGQNPEKDWEASWKISTVTPAAWANINKQLQQEYTSLLQEVDAFQSADIDALDEQLSNGLLGALAHSAYHLGSIRQMIKAIQVPSQA